MNDIDDFDRMVKLANEQRKEKQECKEQLWKDALWYTFRLSAVKFARF